MSLFHWYEAREASITWHMHRLAACIILPLLFGLSPSLMGLLCAAVSAHVWTGLEEIIQDYVHGKAASAGALFLLRCIVLKTMKIVCVLYLV
jgi:succinate dehydrogenase hydrophobic anchor subunit